MKYIVEGEEPDEVARWRAENAASPHLITYDDLPKSDLRKALLGEQGYLCGYTMLRIESVAEGHIEHVVAQSQSRERSTDYLNMIYCYPGDQVSKCPFGAGKKAGAKISDDFISPLDSSCETKFVFARSGAVAGADRAAETTIELLNLNHNVLVQARKAAIAKLPINKTKRPPTAEQAQRYAAELLEKDSDGKYLEFAVALSQVVKRYAQQKLQA